MKPENIQRTFDISEYCARAYGKKPAFYQKKRGKWQMLSYHDYHTLSEKLALGLLTVGLKKGDTVATIFNINCPQWNIIDIALSQIGAIHIPVYPTSSDSDYLYILNQAEVRMVFVGDQSIFNKISSIQKELQFLEYIYSVDKLLNVKNYQELIHLGENSPLETIRNLDLVRKSINSEAVASIIYTSGTTGIPKGVILSHKNIISSMIAAAEIQPLGLSSRILSFLPLCHIYERTANYQFQFKGAKIYYCENMKSLMSNFREVRPHGTTVVPRVLEKIIKIIQVRGGKRGFMINWLINWAIGLGLRYKPYRKRTGFYNIWHGLAYYTVFKKVRASLGGRIQYIGCGGAPINHKVQRFFWACRIPIYEGYGLTEAAPLVSLNYPGKNNYWIGSVGPVVKDVEVKLADDGEILVRGPNVMKGYFKQEELNKETIIDGWLHTGDIGKVIRNRFLQITGRKKQMFKTSYGKYIVPQAIEGRFSDSRVIDYLMVIGEGKHCAGAIICPNFDYLKSVVDLTKKTSNQKLIENLLVKRIIQKEIDRVNKHLGKTERIKKHLIVADIWSAETGELSPTFKIKRNMILKKYNRKIHLMYKEESI